MDIYQLLKQDHQKVKRLFERLAEASDGPKKTRERLFAELKQELELHTQVEEKHFYAALKSFEETKDLVEEALEEHDEMKRMLEELDQADADDEGWDQQLSELQESVEDHVEEEETELFPQAQQVLDQDKADAIAKAIEKDKATAKAK